MQLSVTQGEKQHIVSLPSSFGDGRPFAAKIGEKDITAEWCAQLGLLTVSIDGQVYNIKARHFSKEAFADESEVTTKLEWYDGSTATMRNSEYVIDHHVPGAANRKAAAASAGKSIRSPMTGKVLTIAVKEGDSVTKGDTLLVIEAMKMENKIVATAPGVIHNIQVSAGQSVSVGADLLGIKAE